MSTAVGMFHVNANYPLLLHSERIPTPRMVWIAPVIARPLFCQVN